VELRAQIETAMRNVPQVSHLSGHMGLAKVDQQIGELYEKLAGEYGLAVDVNGLERFGGFGEGSGAMSPSAKEAALVQNLEQLGPGRWLHVEHPGHDVDEMRALGHDGYWGVAKRPRGRDAGLDERKCERGDQTPGHPARQLCGCKGGKGVMAQFVYPPVSQHGEKRLTLFRRIFQYKGDISHVAVKHCVAVGTGLAARPPHRSGRAELPHPAPALDRNAHALQRIGMTDADFR